MTAGRDKILKQVNLLEGSLLPIEHDDATAFFIRTNTDALHVQTKCKIIRMLVDAGDLAGAAQRLESIKINRRHIEGMLHFRGNPGRKAGTKYAALLPALKERITKHETPTKAARAVLEANGMKADKSETDYFLRLWRTSA